MISLQRIIFNTLFDNIGGVDQECKCASGCSERLTLTYRYGDDTTNIMLATVWNHMAIYIVNVLKPGW